MVGNLDEYKEKMTEEKEFSLDRKNPLTEKGLKQMGMTKEKALSEKDGDL